MKHLILALQPYLHHYGYLAVFVAIFLEDFGIPIPGETMLIAASLFATTGGLSIILLVPVALLAAVLGDNVGYGIGRLGGRPLVLRFGRYVLLTPSRLVYAESFFNKRGPIVVVVARFIEVLRQLNGIIAGITRMRWRRFLVYNALGATLWVGFWSVLSYLLGKQGEHIAHLYHSYELPAIVCLVAAAGAVITARAIFKYRRRRRFEMRDRNDPS
jgi:membrane protein DedA with SNARE-associated domain